MNISGKTKVVGIFGYPIAHSLSPLLHNAAFEKLKMDFVYLPFLIKPPELKRAVQGIKALNLIGINVTVPHKQAIIPFLDELSPEASLIGAVNTVHHCQGKLIGYNTDGAGFIESLSQEGGFDPRGKRVLLLGAGGAASAITFSLVEKKVSELFIANRTFKKAQELVDRLKKTASSSCYLAPLKLGELSGTNLLPKIDLLINATSLGMFPEDPPPLSPHWLLSSLFYYDVVYNRRTQLLKAAADKQIRYLDGQEMLIHQAALSFNIWTNQKAPLRKMRRVIQENGKLKFPKRSRTTKRKDELKC